MVMQMQTKLTTSRIPNLHNMSSTLTNHVLKLAHAYPAYLLFYLLSAQTS